MRVALLTREYPPEVYGGAGVHIEHLAAELRGLVDLTVHCIGGPRPGAVAHQPWAALGGANPTLSVLSADLAMAAGVDGFDVLHSHTWYTGVAGQLGRLLHGGVHVLTAHSLEPLRPWKAEQLAGGYAVSSWCERTSVESADALIAVSAAMRRDLLSCYPSVDPDRVFIVHNGVDTARFRPPPAPALPGALAARYGLDPDRPYLLFVGRITAQKGLAHLLDAAELLPADTQLLLCASSPDTPALGAEITRRLARLQAGHPGVRQIADQLPRADLVGLLGGARAFVCPSIYEPLGIVNLEAMACATAVVASAVGGIPEVVADSETGLLVPVRIGADGAPVDPPAFAAGLAAGMRRLLDDPHLAAGLGAAGRRRAVEEFSWPAVAQRTLAVYRAALDSPARPASQ